MNIIAKRLIGTVVALGVALTGAATLVAPAQAASTGVKVGAVSTGNGSLTTPKVSAQGKAKITSKSYKITKSGKTVAKTATASKRIGVAAGTYKVSTTVKYKVGKKKKSYTKTSTVAVKKWNPSSMSLAEYRLIAQATYAEVKAIVGGGGTRTDYTEYPDWDDDGGTVIETTYEFKVTGSDYGFAFVYFTNGRVDSGHYKYYSA